MTLIRLTDDGIARKFVARGVGLVALIDEVLTGRISSTSEQPADARARHQVGHPPVEHDPRDVLPRIRHDFKQLDLGHQVAFDPSPQPVLFDVDVIVGSPADDFGFAFVGVGDSSALDPFALAAVLGDGGIGACEVAGAAVDRLMQLAATGIGGVPTIFFGCRGSGRRHRGRTVTGFGVAREAACDYVDIR